MDDSHHFVFLIDQVPVRFYRGMADDPTARTLRRQEAEAQQLGLALGDEMAEGLIFRLALEADAKGGVDRVVFLALRGEEGHAECAWSVSLEAPVVHGPGSTQLRLIADDGYEGPQGFPPAQRESRPERCTFGKVERVFYINAEVADCALDLRVAKQNLNSAQVSPRLIDDRRLGPPQRVRT